MNDQRFITGIYNYCDYWCERCPFTRRCRNYASSRSEKSGAQSVANESIPDADAVNADFWNDLAEQLRDTKIFGNREAADVEAEDVFEFDDDDEAWRARTEEIEENKRKHPLRLLSCDYMMKVHKWLETADNDLKAVAQRLMEDAKSDFVNDDVEEQARGIGEMLDVISCYHTLISSKLGRAVGGLLEASADEGESVGILAESRISDANGSGKVALIGIERSIGAWLKLRAILPQSEDLILEMLSLLDRLRRRIHIDLPGAESFLRPGFDGEDVGLFD